MKLVFIGSIASILALLLAISTDIFGLGPGMFENKVLIEQTTVPPESSVTTRNSRNQSETTKTKDTVTVNEKSTDPIELESSYCEEILDSVRHIPYASTKAATLEKMARNIFYTRPKCAHELALLIPYVSTRNFTLLFLSDSLLEKGNCRLALIVAGDLPYSATKSSQLSKIGLAMTEESGKCQR